MPTDYFTFPLEEQPPKTLTGLVWIVPAPYPEEMFPRYDEFIRWQFDSAMGRKREQLEEDGRDFVIEGGEIQVHTETTPLDEEFRIYHTVALVTLASPNDATIGDYVHLSAIEGSDESVNIEFNGMQFRKDSAHGYIAWCRTQ